MKKLVFLSPIILIFIFSCNKKTIIKDPQIYNDSLMFSFYKVQYPLDTLILKLHFFKLKFENNPNQIVEIEKIDTSDLLKRYEEIHKSIKNTEKQIRRIKYFKEEKDFRPKMLWALKEMDNMLNSEIYSMVFILKKSNNKKYSEVFYQILPLGKEMYRKYSLAFDSLYYGQQKFDEQNKYILQRNIVKMSF